MSWTTATTLTAQLRRLWQRGELLRPLVTGESRFPLRLTLKGPSSAELANRFDEVRGWIAALAAIPRARIEWRAVEHRVLGAQRVPDSVWIDSPGDAAALLGTRRELAAFETVLARTRSAEPRLLSWLAARPLRSVELADDWDRLLAVVAWRESHPAPGLYLRQVDLPGIDSKFIDTHRGVLAELLDRVLDATQIDPACGVARDFATRYGFREKPRRIRFRVLDPRLPTLAGLDRPDLTLDVASFARLELPATRVIVTENEINFLALPDLDGAIAVFGQGYGWESHAQARWLEHCTLEYWGDIDTHGFAILDGLRSHFPHARSLLMDEATLRAHEAAWGEETAPTQRELPRLIPAERQVYDLLRFDRIRPRLRLEQERIRFGWVERALAMSHA